MSAQPPKTVADLMDVTGLGRDSVRAAIRTGELPGHYVAGRYVIPGEAFDRFCRGEWVPQVRPVFTEPVRPRRRPADPADFVKRRQSA